MDSSFESYGAYRTRNSHTGLNSSDQAALIPITVEQLNALLDSKVEKLERKNFDFFPSFFD